MQVSEVIPYLGVLTPLILGTLGAIKGTKLWRAKRLREMFADRTLELDSKEKELDARDAQLMEELKTEVKALRAEIGKEKQARELQAAEFFRILQSFRGREWRLTEHIHVLETLLKAKDIDFEPLSAELKELPPEINQFFRRSTDPRPPATATPEDNS